MKLIQLGLAALLTYVIAYVLSGTDILIANSGYFGEENLATWWAGWLHGAFIIINFVIKWLFRPELSLNPVEMNVFSGWYYLCFAIGAGIIGTAVANVFGVIFRR